MVLPTSIPRLRRSIGFRGGAVILTLAGMLVVPALVLARPETVSDAGILERQARDTNQPASTRARAIRLWPASLARSRTADLGQWARSQDPGIGSAAVWALGFAGGEAAAAELERVIASPELDPEIRADAVTARARAETHHVEFARAWLEGAPAPVMQAARRVLRLEPLPVPPAQPATVDGWESAVGAGGEVRAGRRVFLSPQVGCVQCHVREGRGRPVGPSLDAPEGLTRRRDWIEGIVDPARVVRPEFQGHSVELRSGESLQGTQLRRAGNGDVTLTDSNGDRRTLAAAAVAVVEALPGSLMPEGLGEAMSLAEFRDLLAYLESRP